MWEWNWVYTKAQLQLMAYDQAITVYKAREKTKQKGYVKPDKEKMEETYRKWKLRKAQNKFNLKKFLGEGKKDNGQQGQNTEHDAQKRG